MNSKYNIPVMGMEKNFLKVWDVMREISEFPEFSVLFFSTSELFLH